VKLNVIVTMFVLVSFLSACAVKPEKEPEKFGTVKSVKVDKQVDKESGQIKIVTTQVEEKAERSIVDKGANALMAPQKVVSFGKYFSSYSVGLDNAVLASVYNSEDGADAGSDLWIYRNGKIRLTNTKYDHSTPSFSQDNRYVYFSSYKGKKNLGQYSQDSYIWRTASTGAGGLTRIGSPSFAYRSASESPNGEHILYSSVELYGNKPYIWYMKNNGALPTQLKQGYSPQWIDDETIIFAAMDESTGLETIWTCKIDGSMLTQIIADNKFNCKHPYPSPDGRHIAYVKEDPKNTNMKQNYAPSGSKQSNIQETRDVYIFNTENGLSQQITTNESRDDLPRWSPDGEYLYFRSSRGLGWNIWRVNASRLVE
jgi:Tol biopolymer transport system component